MAHFESDKLISPRKISKEASPGVSLSKNFIFSVNNNILVLNNDISGVISIYYYLPAGGRSRIVFERSAGGGVTPWKFSDGARIYSLTSY